MELARERSEIGIQLWVKFIKNSECYRTTARVPKLGTSDVLG